MRPAACLWCWFSGRKRILEMILAEGCEKMIRRAEGSVRRRREES
jgi:hypothetical protein